MYSQTRDVSPKSCTSSSSTLQLVDVLQSAGASHMEIAHSQQHESVMTYSKAHTTSTSTSASASIPLDKSELYCISQPTLNFLSNDVLVRQVSNCLVFQHTHTDESRHPDIGEQRSFQTRVERQHAWLFDAEMPLSCYTTVPSMNAILVATTNASGVSQILVHSYPNRQVIHSITLSREHMALTGAQQDVRAFGKIPENLMAVMKLAVSPDGTRLYAVQCVIHGGISALRVWTIGLHWSHMHLETHTVVANNVLHQLSSVQFLQVSPNGTSFVIGDAHTVYRCAPAGVARIAKKINVDRIVLPEQSSAGNLYRITTATWMNEKDVLIGTDTGHVYHSRAADTQCELVATIGVGAHDSQAWLYTPQSTDTSETKRGEAICAILHTKTYIVIVTAHNKGMYWCSRSLSGSKQSKLQLIYAEKSSTHTRRARRRDRGRNITANKRDTTLSACFSPDYSTVLTAQQNGRVIVHRLCVNLASFVKARKHPEKLTQSAVEAQLRNRGTRAGPADTNSMSTLTADLPAQVLASLQPVSTCYISECPLAYISSSASDSTLHNAGQCCIIPVANSNGNIEVVASVSRDGTLRSWMINLNPSDEADGKHMPDGVLSCRQLQAKELSVSRVPRTASTTSVVGVECQRQVDIDSRPSVCKYSAEWNLLIMGFNSGAVAVLDASAPGDMRLVYWQRLFLDPVVDVCWSSNMSRTDQPSIAVVSETGVVAFVGMHAAAQRFEAYTAADLNCSSITATTTTTDSPSQVQPVACVWIQTDTLNSIIVATASGSLIRLRPPHFNPSSHPNDAVTIAMCDAESLQIAHTQMEIVPSRHGLHTHVALPGTVLVLHHSGVSICANIESTLHSKRLELTTLLNHDIALHGALTNLSWSADGSQMLVTSKSGAMDLFAVHRNFDYVTADRMPLVLQQVSKTQPYYRGISALSIGFSNSGKRMVSLGADGSILMWRIHSDTTAVNQESLVCVSVEDKSSENSVAYAPIDEVDLDPALHRSPCTVQSSNNHRYAPVSAHISLDSANADIDGSDIKHADELEADSPSGRLEMHSRARRRSRRQTSTSQHTNSSSLHGDEHPIQQKIQHLQQQLLSLIDANSRAEPEKRVATDKLVLDASRLQRLIEDADHQGEKLRSELRRNLLSSKLMMQRYKTEFYETMNMEPQSICSFVHRQTVHNIPMSRMTGAQRRLFRQIWMHRSIEILDGAALNALPAMMATNGGAQARRSSMLHQPEDLQLQRLVEPGRAYMPHTPNIDSMSLEVLDLQGTAETVIMESNARQSTVASRSPTAKLSATQKTATGTNSSASKPRKIHKAAEAPDPEQLTIEQIDALLYMPIDVMTRNRRRTQCFLLQLKVRCLIRDYNAQFDSLKVARMTEVDRIQERRLQLAEINAELKLAPDFEQHEQQANEQRSHYHRRRNSISSSMAMDQAARQAITATSLFQQADTLISGTAIMPADTHNTRNGTGINGDDLHHAESSVEEKEQTTRALQEMMDGSLKPKLKESIFNVRLEREEWMETVAPADMDDDQKVAIASFHKRAERLAEEQSNHRKMLDTDAAKITSDITDIMAQFDSKLASLSKAHTRARERSLEQQLHLARIAADFGSQERTAAQQLERHKLLLSLAKQAQGVQLDIREVDELRRVYQERVDALNGEERVADRRFKFEFREAGGSMDRLYELFKLRKPTIRSGSAATTRSGSASKRTARSDRRSTTTRRKRASRGSTNSNMSGSSNNIFGDELKAGGLTRDSNDTRDFTFADTDFPDMLQLEDLNPHESANDTASRAIQELALDKRLKPEDISANIWAQFVSFRDQQILRELETNKVSGMLQQLDDFVDELYQRLENLSQSYQREWLEHCRCANLQLIAPLNANLLLHLPHGQVELGAQLTIPDHSELVMLNRSQIESLNAQLCAHGGAKLVSLREIANVNRTHQYALWQDSMLQHEHDEAVGTTRDVQLIRVTKELQELLRMGGYDQRAQTQHEQLEHRLDFLEHSAARDQLGQRLKLTRMKKRIRKFTRENSTLRRMVAKLITSGREREQIAQLQASMHKPDSADQRMRQVIMKRRIMDEIKSQAADIEALRTEAIRLRRRTFANFDHASPSREFGDRKITSAAQLQLRASKVAQVLGRAESLPAPRSVTAMGAYRKPSAKSHQSSRPPSSLSMPRAGSLSRSSSVTLEPIVRPLSALLSQRPEATASALDMKHVQAVLDHEAAANDELRKHSQSSAAYVRPLSGENNHKRSNTNGTTGKNSSSSSKSRRVGSAQSRASTGRTSSSRSVSKLSTQ
jgi:hypothetical protein